MWALQFCVFAMLFWAFQVSFMFKVNVRSSYHLDINSDEFACKILLKNMNFIGKKHCVKFFLNVSSFDENKTPYSLMTSFFSGMKCGNQNVIIPLHLRF